MKEHELELSNRHGNDDCYSYNGYTYMVMFTELHKTFISL